MDNEINQKLATQLAQKWEITSPEAASNADLHLILTQRIAEMLKNELETLLFIMYRMDIAENDFQAAMKLGSIAEISTKIAELVIKRELQKIYTRKLFT
jgi:hypothetical protein